jgi:glycosyltransferase involved in cell wall biosynthesis
LAAQIKRALGVPLVVSLHTHPDESYRRRAVGWKARLMGWRQLMFERETLRAADWVLPVYESIVPYAQRRGARRVRVCYNMLNPSLGRKTDYTLHNPPRLISVGRQMPGKEPDQIIRAVARLPGVQLTMVGDGVYHARLRALAEAEGIADRVDFYRAIPNAELCRMLPGYDIFAVHCDYAGVPKAVLEPLLAGLPVVMNRRQGTPVPELQGDWVMLVENTVAGYYEALRQLLADHATREALGRCAYAHAQARYAPEQTEQAFVDIYYSLLETGIK